jgi:hypothetical protein
MHPKILPIPDVHAAFALPGNEPAQPMLYRSGTESAQVEVFAPLHRKALS